MKKRTYYIVADIKKPLSNDIEYIWKVGFYLRILSRDIKKNLKVYHWRNLGKAGKNSYPLKTRKITIIFF